MISLTSPNLYVYFFRKDSIRALISAKIFTTVPDNYKKFANIFSISWYFEMPNTWK